MQYGYPQMHFFYCFASLLNGIQGLSVSRALSYRRLLQLFINVIVPQMAMCTFVPYTVVCCVSKFQI